MDAPDLSAEVDPLIGTAPSDAPNPVVGGAGGSVFPGPVAPFGMVQWSPDTPGSEPSGYAHTDHVITAFSLTHFSGAGCPNNGEIPIMPTLDPRVPAAGFQHSSERASPGYYGVTLDSGIRVELTATQRTGLGRFAFPPGSAPRALAIDAGRTSTLRATDGEIVQDGSAALSGYTTGGWFCAMDTLYRVYFVLEADQPFSSVVVKQRVAIATFDPKSANVVRVRVGLSYVSVDNARANLRAESPGWDFDATSQRLRAEWNRRLSVVRVEGGSRADRTKLYTALYHSLMFPSVFSDVNGGYIGFDGRRRRVEGGHVLYANFSGWDIYRSEVQLLAMLFPAEMSDMLQSLVLDAAQCGALPKWSQNNVETGVMVGDPGAIIVASGDAFGATGFDRRAALATMLRTGEGGDGGCNGRRAMTRIHSYLAHGYIAAEPERIGDDGAASTTLEYTSRDFAVAQLARALGDDRSYRQLMARSRYWLAEVHDDGSLQARRVDGTWRDPLDGPGEGNNREYIEGNAEQYVWMVPYDPRGLFDVLGGDDAVVKRLDAFFSRLNAGLSEPYFYMGNEPNFATPWLYDWAGAPWRTQDVVRRIADESFQATPGGLPGNDDLGATSSWFVFAALGLYPSVPGVAGFAVGSPIFPLAVVKLGGGRELVIRGDGAPARYVQGLEVGGKPHASPWVTYDALRDAGTMTFKLGPAPSRWGSGRQDAPPSFDGATFAGLADALNDSGITRDGEPTGAGFDGWSRSYSREALVAATAATGGRVTVGGVTFPWPGAGGSAVGGSLDNVVAVGQTIGVSPPARGSKLAILGAASGGTGLSAGTGLLSYRDGTTAPFTLGFDDWSLRSGADKPSPGARVALRLPYRNGPKGHEAVEAYVFYAEVKLDPARELASVRLPRRVSSGRLHVFAWSVVP